MATRPRIKRLHDLLDQIAMLPVSPERDRLLTEIRSRAVDVDTGVKPRAMLPMQEPSPPPVVRTPPQRERVRAPRRRSPPPAAPAVELPRPAPAAGRSKLLEEPLKVDGRLSLEDSLLPSPLPLVRTRGARAVPPWTLGLRG